MVLVDSGKSNQMNNPFGEYKMRPYANIIMKQLQRGTRVLLTSVLLVVLGSAPATAGDFLAGQSYFSLSGMMAKADGATVDSAGGTNNPAFNFSKPQLETNTGFGVAGAYGWLTDTNWRFEAELSHRRLGLNGIVSQAPAALKGDLSITTAFVNVLRDFRSESFITPYFGIGVGGSYHKLDVGSIGGPPDFGVRDGFALVYQAMLGLSFEVGEDTDIFAGYRFMGAWEPDYEAFALERIDISTLR